MTHGEIKARQINYYMCSGEGTEGVAMNSFMEEGRVRV